MQGVTGKPKFQKHVTRVIHVKGLPSNTSNDDLYEIFGKYGSVRQIRVGIAPETKSHAYVVYDDVADAQAAVEHLHGFNVAGRYLAVCNFDYGKQVELEMKRRTEDELRSLRARSGFL